jgi:hypothetical protein
MTAAIQSLLGTIQSPPFPLGTFTFNSSSAAMTIAWPSGHQTDDIGFLFISSANQAISTPTGWNVINTPTGVGTAGTNGVRLAAFWKRATSSSEAAVSISDSGSENEAVMVALRGADLTASPVEAITGDTLGVASASVTVPSAAAGINRYFLGAVAGSIGVAGADNNTSVTWTTNSNINSFVELADYGTSEPGVILGVFGGTGAGDPGSTSGTLAVAGIQERVFFAVKPRG